MRHLKFDGMIITGAPVEDISFEEVDYWEEICEIMDWAQTHVTSTLHICWAAQAAFTTITELIKGSCPESCLGSMSIRWQTEKSPW